MTELVKVDVNDDATLLAQSKSSPVRRAAKVTAIATLSAAIVFGACYAALTLFSHNNRGNDNHAAYSAQYAAARQETVSPGVPRIHFYNGSVYDGFELPQSDGAEHNAAPAIGWTKLVHKDAEYGPIREGSTAEEFEEVVESITDPDVLAALQELLPDVADTHASGSAHASGSEAAAPARRGLFFEAQPSDLPGVIGATDRRREPSCNEVSTTAHLRPIVDLLSVAHCSGTLIGPNLVLTAGHCLRNGGANGEWMLPNAVTPRACGGSGQMNGRRTGYNVISVWVHASWAASGAAGGWGNDVGLVWLAPAFGRQAGDVNGFISTAADTRSSLSVAIHGYPGQAGNPPANQFHNVWGMSGTISSAVDGGSATFTTTAIDVSGGTSGSGVIAASPTRVVGILVAGQTAPNRINIMARLTNAQIALINSARPSQFN